jgi:hypothetical protein
MSALRMQEPVDRFAVDDEAYADPGANRYVRQAIADFVPPT